VLLGIHGRFNEFLASSMVTTISENRCNFWESLKLGQSIVICIRELIALVSMLKTKQMAKKLAKS